MHQQEPFLKKRLFCPGPTPIPDATLVAGFQAAGTYHRTEEFYETFNRCRTLLGPLFGATNLPLILSCSGSGAMEAAMVNLTDRGDEIVVVNGGKFGERWEQLGSTYGCKVQEVRAEWGDTPKMGSIIAALEHCSKPKAVFFQASETSTGVYNPVREWAEAIRKHASDCLIVVDAISSICAHRMKMDEWDIDAVVAGSQKGFGIPPGLAFIALSDRSRKNLSKRERFYFDLAREYEGQEKGRSSFTPATSLISALAVSLETIDKIGVDAVANHHARLGTAARLGLKALGLTLLARENPSNSVSAARLPDKVDGVKLLQNIRASYGATLAGGQGRLKGKIVRLAHLGFVDSFHLLQGLAALEFGLKDAGYQFDLGAGVAAAMQSLGGQGSHKKS